MNHLFSQFLYYFQYVYNSYECTEKTTLEEWGDTGPLLAFDLFSLESVMKIV